MELSNFFEAYRPRPVFLPDCEVRGEDVEDWQDLPLYLLVGILRQESVKVFYRNGIQSFRATWASLGDWLVLNVFWSSKKGWQADLCWEKRVLVSKEMPPEASLADVVRTLSGFYAALARYADSYGVFIKGPSRAEAPVEIPYGFWIDICMPMNVHNINDMLTAHSIVARHLYTGSRIDVALVNVTVAATSTAEKPPFEVSAEYLSLLTGIPVSTEPVRTATGWEHTVPCYLARLRCGLPDFFSSAPALSACIYENALQPFCVHTVVSEQYATGQKGDVLEVAREGGKFVNRYELSEPMKALLAKKPTLSADPLEVAQAAIAEVLGPKDAGTDEARRKILKGVKCTSTVGSVQENSALLMASVLGAI